MRIPFSDYFSDGLLEIVRGSSIVFSLKVAGAGLAFVFNIVLARLLGADGTGAYFLALTVLTVGSIIGRFGLDNVLVRRSATGADQENWSEVLGVHRTGMGIALLLAAATGTTIFFLSPWIAERGFGNIELSAPIAYMGLAVVPLVLSRLYSQLLKGLGHLVAFSLIQKQGILIPGVSIAATYVLCGEFGWGVEGAVFAFIGAASVATVAGGYFWKRAVPARTSSESTQVTSLLRPASSLFGVEALGFMREQASILLLGIWATEAEVGIYGTAMRVSLLTAFILVAVNSVVSPRIAALYEKRDMEELDRVSRNAVKICTVLATPPLLVFVIAPEFVLSLFGHEFTTGAVPLIVLAVAQFINVSTGPVGYLLIMTGRESIMRNVDALATTVGLVLYVTLIPQYGVLGAALAYGFAISTRYFVAALMVHRTLDIALFGPMEVVNDVLGRMRA